MRSKVNKLTWNDEKYAYFLKIGSHVAYLNHKLVMQVDFILRRWDFDSYLRQASSNQDAAQLAEMEGKA